MTPEQATAEIVELVYHSAVIHPDPYVQETHIETSIRDILEELVGPREDDLEYELQKQEREVERLEDEIGILEGQIEDLTARLPVMEATVSD